MKTKNGTPSLRAPSALSFTMPFALATYNVKNLLQAEDGAGKDILQRKLDETAAMIRACDADVVGLQEVGAPEIARELGARLEVAGYDAAHSVLGTADGRGIRCALVSRLPLASARVCTSAALSFPTFHQGDPPPFGTRIPLRRGIVQASVNVAGLGRVHIFVAHFKSPRPLGQRHDGGLEIAPTNAHERAQGLVRATVWRAAEALYTRALVDEVLAGDAGAHVAVAGDLNDVPSSAVLRALRSDGEGALVDCAAGIAPASRYSLIHEGRPHQVDHILATAGLGARLIGARFLNANLRDHGLTLDDTITTDSDHAPLVATFA